MARSLNKVQLIGNLTRDPELRYTPSGAAVCSFGLATNRSWTQDNGEKKEETEFHNIVAWNKLAELCSQFLLKGRKIYVEGRLATRSWDGQDGQKKQRTEIVIDDMLLLDNKGNAPVKEETPPAPPVGDTAAAVQETIDDAPATSEAPIDNDEVDEGIKKQIAEREAEGKPAPVKGKKKSDIPF